MNYINENDKKPNNIPEEYKEYIDIYKGDEEDTFILKLISKKDKEKNNLEDEDIIEEDVKRRIRK